MGHSHGPSAPPAPRQVRIWLAVAVVPFAVAVLAGLVVLWPGQVRARQGPEAGQPAKLVNATVTDVTFEPCPGGGGRCASAFIRITSGPDKGETPPSPSRAECARYGP